MAELDTRIPLSVKPVQLEDPVAKYVQFAQLQGMQGQQKLIDLKVKEAEREEKERVTLREAFTKYPNAAHDPEQERSLLGEISAVSPELGMKYRQNILVTQRAAREEQAAKLDMQKKQMEMVTGWLGGVLEIEKAGGNVQDAWSEVLARGKAMNLPNVEQWSQVYDSKMVNDRYLMGVDRLKQLEMAKVEVAIAGAKQEQELKPKEFQLKQGQLDATLRGQDLSLQASREGHAASTRNAQITAGGMVEAAERAGQKAYKVEEMKLAAQRQFEPLTGEAAKTVSEYNAMIGSLNVLGEKFDPSYTGPIRGRYAAFMELTGDITKDEVQFRRRAKDIKDQLARARSGAAIGEKELKTLEDLVPDPKSPPNVFLARLEDFGRELERQRDERIRTATTGRGSMAGPYVQTPPAAPTAPATPPASKPAPATPAASKPAATPPGASSGGFKILGIEEVK